MSFIRNRMPESEFKAVERNEEFSVFRWDAEKEMVNVPIRKKGKKKEEEPEYETKESGYLVFTECILHGEVTNEILQKEIDADLAIRYPNGGAPVIKAEDFI